ncbi:MAG: hypothetical protein OXC83_00965 [Chloroflexi bacterium]|nr:hypothetical protein [Chloroflexota bacterium]
MSGSDKWPGEIEDTRALAEAYVRIDEAAKGVDIPRDKFRDFHYETVRMMVDKGIKEDANGPVPTLPPTQVTDKGQVSDDIRHAYVKILEDLRAALDCGATQAALKLSPDLPEDAIRKLEFIIASSEKGFRKRAKYAFGSGGDTLEPLKQLMECLQPYHGDERLWFLSRASGSSKHRGLSEVQHATKLHTILSKSTDQQRLADAGWWVFPTTHECIVLARTEQSHLTVRVPNSKRRHDPLVVPPICIEHVRAIINTLEYCVETGNLPQE